MCQNNSDQVVERHGFEERVEFITEFVVGEQSSSQVVPYTEDIDEGKVKRELPTTNPKYALMVPWAVGWSGGDWQMSSSEMYLQHR